MISYKKCLFSKALPVIILVFSVLVFFRDILLSGGQLYGSDFILQFWPWKRFVYDTIQSHGTLPFWNPYALSGTPSIANMQISVFYPLGFLYYLVPPEFAYGYSTILHCIMGSLFMFIFVRTLGVSSWSAFLSAFIFTFNGFFMAHLYAGHLSFVQNYIWIPLIFCCLYRFIRTLQLKWALFAGLFLGIQILGGFPQIAFYTILAALSFGLVQMAIALRAKAFSAAKRMGVGIGVMIFMGFALSAIQLLPTWQFTGLSGRAGGVSYWFATLDSLHPKLLVSFLIPGIFGSAADWTYWLSPKDWHFWETFAYVSVFGLALLFVPSPHKKHLKTIRGFFVGLVIVSLFLALGKYNPLYPLIFRLPGFHSFRIPAQILFLFVFATSVLSGIAIDRLEEAPSRIPKALVLFLIVGSLGFLFVLITAHWSPYDFFYHLFKLFAEQPVDSRIVQDIPDKIFSEIYRSSLLFFATASLFIFLKKGFITPTRFKMAVLAVVIIDLGLYTSQFVKPNRFVMPKEKQIVASQLRQNAEVERIFMASNLFSDNDGSFFGLETINGYDPLVLGRYILFLQASQGLPLVKEVITTNFISRYDHKFLKMLNLTHVLRGKDVTHVGPALPRAMLVNSAIVKPTEVVLDFMKSDSFDPFSTVVFEPENASMVWPSPEGEPFRGSCSITEYGNETMRIRSTSNQPCYLVVTEMYYPGWEATVDGHPAPVLRGNYLFRVIPLESGEHDVQIRFVCRPFQAGMVISIMTLMAMSVFLVVLKRRNEKS